MGEQIAVYETGDKYEPFTHLAVLRDGRRAAEFQLDGSKNAFVSAYRNIGDGSGTIFLLVVPNGTGYALAMNRATVEGRFKVMPDRTIEIWDAEDRECVWCPHQYKVSKMKWQSGSLATVNVHTTKHKISPYLISDSPIVIASANRLK